MLIYVINILHNTYMNLIYVQYKRVLKSFFSYRKILVVVMLMLFILPLKYYICTTYIFFMILLEHMYAYILHI